MDSAAALAAFDEQVRRHPKTEGPEVLVESDERITRVVAVADGDGWNGVIWSNLTEADADEVIAAQIRRFASCDDAWEWKQYSYDRPADLPDRLRAAGFAPEPPETLLVAEIAELALDSSPPAGVHLVPVTDLAGADALVAVHDEVFGGSHGHIGRAVLAALDARPSPVTAVVAMAGSTPISAGRVEFSPDSDFASIWGGGTLAAWRGRGVFRSLVAWRAALAQERGYRYLQVDASADSRPILQRLGFVELAKTTPYKYQAASRLPPG